MLPLDDTLLVRGLDRVEINWFFVVLLSLGLLDLLWRLPFLHFV